MAGSYGLRVRGTSTAGEGGKGQVGRGLWVGSEEHQADSAPPPAPWLMKAAGPSQSWAQRLRVEYMMLKSFSPARSRLSSGSVSSAMQPTNSSSLSFFLLRGWRGVSQDPWPRAYCPFPASEKKGCPSWSGKVTDSLLSSKMQLPWR